MSLPTTRQRSLLWLALSLALLSPARAQESLADLVPFREGCQALADERFGTAVTHFRACWDLLEKGETTGPEGNFVAARLLEALVKDGAAAEAVIWFEAQESFLPTPATSYWIAAALEAEERFAEAAEFYQLHLAATPGAPPSVLLNRAVCLSRSGQREAAFDLVASAIQPATPNETLRLAQIAAAAGRTQEALTFLQKADPADAAWTPLRLSLTRLRSALLWQRGDRKGSVATVFALLDLATSPEEARQGFLLLETLLEGERPAGLTERMKAWVDSPTYPGKETARLFQIVLLGDVVSREADLSAFAAATTDPALKVEASLRLTDPPALAAGDLAADLRKRLDFSIGSRAYLAGAFADAARHFTTLAEQSGGETASRDLFNAAVAALRGDDSATFAALEETLARHNPRSGYLADLSYLGGLHFAAQGDPSAFDRLTAFVQEHPDHASNIDAQLALAEIHLNQAPARSRAAREIFDVLRTRPLTLAQSERLEYNSVWVELTEGDDTALLQRAGEFVANWPGSRYLGEILMILAAEQVARRNFEAAATSFRRVADEFPDSPHAETARFFEAKTSAANDATVAKWRQLIEAKGPLANEAAHELALLFLSLDRFDEARAELAALLERLGETAPLRFAIMADLAYASYLEALATGRDAAKLSEAADRFAALSNLDSAPALWRYNAAVRRGKCLEALGKAPVALEIYRSIVEETRTDNAGLATPLAPGETEWVFRAGFAAIEILNAEKNWAASIEIADALAEKSGPRAIEATRLAEKLRLKHWVWD
jgi:tetratricopeptide (TPR) repeat protein